MFIFLLWEEDMKILMDWVFKISKYLDLFYIENELGIDLPGDRLALATKCLKSSEKGW